MRISDFGECMASGSSPEGCARYAAHWLGQLAAGREKAERLRAIPDTVPDMDTLPPAPTRDEEDEAMDILTASAQVRAGLVPLVLCKTCPILELWETLNNPPYGTNKNTPD